MVDIGMNEALEIRDSPEGLYFILWPFGAGPQWGNYYQVAVESVDDRVRVSAPAMPGFVGEGSTVREAESRLLAAIKASLYRVKNFLDEAMPLIARHIVPDPDHPGEDNVCVVPERIPVWAIIGSMRADHAPDEQPGYYDRFINDATIQQTAMEYGISADAVRAAVAYYYWHTVVIDARVAANNVAV